jgi:hypothetical protein
VGLGRDLLCMHLNVIEQGSYCCGPTHSMPTARAALGHDEVSDSCGGRRLSSMVYIWPLPCGSQTRSAVKSSVKELGGSKYAVKECLLVTG